MRVKYENIDYYSLLRYNSLSATLKLILLDLVARSPPFNLSQRRGTMKFERTRRDHKLRLKIILRSDVSSVHSFCSFILCAH